MHYALAEVLAALGPLFRGFRDGGEVLRFLAATLGVLPAAGAVTSFVLNNARRVIMVGLTGTGRPQELPEGLVPIEEVRFRPMRLRGRRGFAVHVSIRTHNLSPASRIGLELRVRGPGGKPLGAALPRYQDEHGEFLVRELSQPIGETDAFLVTLGTLFPIVALALPVGPDQRATLTAHVAVQLEGRVEGRAEAPLDFIPREEDFLPTLEERPREPAAPLVAGELEVVAEATPGHEAPCPVCGDALEPDDTWECCLCEVGHHGECWTFAGRCSTYACLGDAAPVPPVD